MTQRSIDVTPRTEDAIAIRDAIYKLEDQLPVEVTDEVIEKAAWWGATVLAGNDTLNLTRITDPDEMALKHFIDSWSVMGVLRDVPAGATLLDIGTGAAKNRDVGIWVTCRGNRQGFLEICIVLIGRMDDIGAGCQQVSAFIWAEGIKVSGDERRYDFVA